MVLLDLAKRNHGGILDLLDLLGRLAHAHPHAQADFTNKTADCMQAVRL
jgi:hypothetical protein